MIIPTRAPTIVVSSLLTMVVPGSSVVTVVSKVGVAEVLIGVDVVSKVCVTEVLIGVTLVSKVGVAEGANEEIEVRTRGTEVVVSTGLELVVVGVGSGLEDVDIGNTEVNDGTCELGTAIKC